MSSSSTITTPLRSYGGGVAGLAATNPSVTGKKLKDNKGAVSAYEQHAATVTSKISAAVKSAVPSVAIGTAYTTVYGGVAATVPANKVADLLKVPGVAAVQQDSLQQPLDDNTAFIGATAVWPSSGRCEPGRFERDRRRDRYRSLAGASDAVADRRLRAVRRPEGLPVRQRERRGQSWPRFRLQQQAHRRLCVHCHVHGEQSRWRERVLQRRDEGLLRRATPKATGRTR
jgi:hypothetical protein